MPAPSRPLVAVLAAVLLLAGCTSAVPGGGPQPLKLEKRGPSGAVPAGLEQFYAQPLGWGSCLGYGANAEQQGTFAIKGVECARLTVPLDYAAPQGRTVSLGLLRRPAKQQNQRIGALVLNPGGPGASGMTAAAQLGLGLGDSGGLELAKTFDLVGFDPRGVDASEPQVRCRTDAERDADRLDSDVDTSEAGVAQTEAEERAYAASCAERVGTEVLANVGTREVVKDLDVLRSALGEPKLNYLGYSYGTRIGTAYAEAFPANVRAMVLDGAVNPSQDPTTELLEQGAGFQKAFDAFSRWCVVRTNCALGVDPLGTVEQFRKLTKPLVDKPAEVTGGRKLSYSDAITATVQALYAEALWEQLNQGLGELAKGKGDELMSLADIYYGRGADGRYSTQLDSFTAVRCVDSPRVTDQVQVREGERRYRQAAPFLDDGRPAGGARDACAFWPVPPTSQPHQLKVDGLPQLMVISTTGDPATPYQAGVDLAKALGARLLTVTANQHTAFLQGMTCVDQAGTRYFVELKLPNDGTVCDR